MESDEYFRRMYSATVNMESTEMMEHQPTDLSERKYEQNGAYNTYDYSRTYSMPVSNQFNPWGEIPPPPPLKMYGNGPGVPAATVSSPMNLEYIPENSLSITPVNLHKYPSIPARYSPEPPKRYPSEPLNSFSQEPHQRFSPEPQNSYSQEPPQRFSPEPQHSFSQEPPQRSFSQEPPQRSFSQEPPQRFSPEPEPPRIYPPEPEPPRIYSSEPEPPRIYSSEPSNTYHQEPPEIYNNPQQPHIVFNSQHPKVYNQPINQILHKPYNLELPKVYSNSELLKVYNNPELQQVYSQEPLQLLKHMQFNQGPGISEPNHIVHRKFDPVRPLGEDYSEPSDLDFGREGETSIEESSQLKIEVKNEPISNDPTPSVSNNTHGRLNITQNNINITQHNLNTISNNSSPSPSDLSNVISTTPSTSTITNTNTNVIRVKPPNYQGVSVVKKVTSNINVTGPSTGPKPSAEAGTEPNLERVRTGPLSEKNFPIFVKRKDYDPAKDVINVSDDSSSGSGSSDDSDDDDSDSDDDSSSDDSDDGTDEFGFNDSAIDFAVNKISKKEPGAVSQQSAKKPFVCSVCGFAAALWMDLKQHMKIHGTTKKKYRCKECHFDTDLEAEFKVHKIVHKTDPMLGIKCSECDYTSSIKALMVQHMMKHTGEKPFKCEHIGCDYSTRLRANLKTHMMKHTGEKPYKCIECDYASAQKGNLKNHMRKHDREKMIADVAAQQVNRPIDYEPYGTADEPADYSDRQWYDDDDDDMPMPIVPEVIHNCDSDGEEYRVVTPDKLLNVLLEHHDVDKKDSHSGDEGDGPRIKKEIIEDSDMHMTKHIEGNGSVSSDSEAKKDSKDDDLLPGEIRVKEEKLDGEYDGVTIKEEQIEPEPEDEMSEKERLEEVARNEVQLRLIGMKAMQQFFGGDGAAPHFLMSGMSEPHFLDTGDHEDTMASNNSGSIDGLPGLADVTMAAFNPEPVEEVRSYACTDCSYTTTKRAEVMEHMTKEHGKTYTCGECGYKSTLEADLYAHQIMEHA
ncbi:unnamed protein product, partial [Meganyctiphanes norvegica]